MIGKIKSFIASLVRTDSQMQNLRINVQKYAIINDVDLSDPILSNFNQKQQRENKKTLKIGFLIPGLAKFSGGITSILRLGTILAGLGHQVYYVSLTKDDIPFMKGNAESNLPGYRGTIINFDGIEHADLDIAIATIWWSCYYLWNVRNVRYKAYFIQDYEPFFYKKGDLYTLAEKSYALDFHLISLGGWNKKQIEDKVKVHADSITFPFEPKQFSPSPNWEEKFVLKNKIKIIVYLKNDEKRGPILLLLCLNLLTQLAKSKGKELEVCFFGNDKDVKYPVEFPYINLGRPPSERLRELYRESDFGIVFSYTNISLVPLEMMACACPVVEVEEGSYGNFFSPDCAILTPSLPLEFCKKLFYYIEHPEDRKTIAEQGLKMVSTRTWQSAGEELNQLLLENYNK